MKIDLQNIDSFHSKFADFTRVGKIQERLCDGCDTPLTGLSGIVMQKNKGKNLAICQECCQVIIDAGVEDLHTVYQVKQKIKQEMIDFIKQHEPYKRTADLDIENLQLIVDKINARHELEALIEADITANYVETPTEQYLKDDYDVYECAGMQSHLEIPGYFKDCGQQFFDCGQGYYEEEADVLVKIGNKFYEVHIEAETDSQRMDVGDRVYWIDKITDVTYEEVEKPKPLLVKEYSYDFNLTLEEKERLEALLEKHNFKYS
jgi:hypothetical protein